MDSFFSFFVKQKKLALVFTVSVIVVGLFSLFNIQRDQFPVVDFEVVTIVTAYSGASPEDVEQNVTNPIEDELRGITGIDSFTSFSREGISSIFVTLSQDTSDIGALKQEITNAVDRVRSFPKEVVDLPKVVDRKISLRSILKVNLSSKTLSFSELRNSVDVIARELELVDGVSEVVKEGYLDREIQIRIDTDKLYQYELSLPQVIDAIEKRNNCHLYKRQRKGKNHHQWNNINKFTHCPTH
jgi:multidrug efflux pump subunit AcrB